MNKEEFGLFRDIWHIGTDMMCQDYVKPAYRLKEKIIATFKENKELKKRLEEYKENYQEELNENCKLSELWCDSRAKIKKLENQQKEFIDYLEERIKVCDNRLSTPFCNFEKTTKERLILSQCLEKLEEIIGVSDENRTTL